jgi:hypothetical protein
MLMACGNQAAFTLMCFGNGTEGSGTDITHYQVPMGGYLGPVTITCTKFRNEKLAMSKGDKLI